MLDPLLELRHTGVVKFPQSVQGAEAAAAAATHDGQTRSAVVRLLLESGSITAGQIGERLGLSAAGVRRHLDALIDMGEAESVPAAPWQQAGRGRPAKRYRLTSTGRAKLDHSYDDLASAAMRQLREIGGEEAVRSFARQRIDAILSGVEAADVGRRRRHRSDRRAGRRRVEQGRLRRHHRPRRWPNPRRADLSASLPGIPRRRGVSGAVRNRAAGHGRGPRDPRAAACDHRQR